MVFLSASKVHASGALRFVLVLVVVLDESGVVDESKHLDGEEFQAIATVTGRQWSPAPAVDCELWAVCEENIPPWAKLSLGHSLLCW